ncbi:zinc-finger domain-containing protein [Rhodospirillum rubrum]|uniref:zinc-finger domain-containing protein n=1 Tax=Rhodospirillum rubrum TaxID=1085 RepID=UPI0000379F42|nr:zinc-finger domain-containing protein [Rhodospirillum rubrum]AEO46542.1 hypothetical protein F11_00355 [Rhodospirillum rubrum F11]MBK5952432.1 zinc-finger domain-containing protein [Rhodospirillum rubrum]QXG80576.1 zinc-finger domain-containing protein [Rhodospirillum rubrum]HCF17944.1 zinc-finger domain-containing protein [Rhodospirillum rubrum]
MSHEPTFPVTETVTVESLTVVCDGGGGALGHPAIYLHIKPAIGKVCCPYCSRSYVASPQALTAAPAH